MDWKERNNMRMRRLNALNEGEANEVARLFKIDLVTGLMVVVMIIAAIIHPSLRAGLAEFVAILVCRFIARTYQKWKYTIPDLERIDREFPNPPPLEPGDGHP